MISWPRATDAHSPQQLILARFRHVQGRQGYAKEHHKGANRRNRTTRNSLLANKRGVAPQKRRTRRHPEGKKVSLRDSDLSPRRAISQDVVFVPCLAARVLWSVECLRGSRWTSKSSPSVIPSTTQSTFLSTAPHPTLLDSLNPLRASSNFTAVFKALGMSLNRLLNRCRAQW